MGLEPTLDVRAHPLDRERLLRDEDHVRAAGQARMQSDPSGVSTHYLYDERTVMGFRRRVQPVDRLHRDVHRRVEAERVVGGAQIVVDRLGHPDDADAELAETGRDTERVLAADRDERVDAVLVQCGRHLVEAMVDLERVGARRPEYRAAARQDATDFRHAEGHGDVLERSLPAVPVAHEFVAVHADALAHDGTDHCVQAGTVTATGEDSDTHRQTLSAEGGSPHPPLRGAIALRTVSSLRSRGAGLFARALIAMWSPRSLSSSELAVLIAGSPRAERGGRPDQRSAVKDRQRARLWRASARASC